MYNVMSYCEPVLVVRVRCCIVHAFDDSVSEKVLTCSTTAGLHAHNKFVRLSTSSNIRKHSSTVSIQFKVQYTAPIVSP
jgi:hypothetical protein